MSLDLSAWRSALNALRSALALSLPCSAAAGAAMASAATPAARNSLVMIKTPLNWIKRVGDAPVPPFIGESGPTGVILHIIDPVGPQALDREGHEQRGKEVKAQ